MIDRILKGGGALVLLCAALALLAGCAPGVPDPSAERAFIDRAQGQEQLGVTVRASVLTNEEAARYFGKSPAGDVQPVWLEVRNDSDDPVLYVPILTDPDYYAPMEVAQPLHGWFSGRANARMDAAWTGKRMPEYVGAHRTVSGFVYTHRDGGVKFLNVGLAGSGRVRRFRFAIPIPGVQYAVQQVDFGTLYAPGAIEDLTLDALRARLETLPCCVSDKSAVGHGDPLNLVIVGNGLEALFDFTGRGWRLNEPVDAGSSWRMAKAFLLRSSYETAPVSPLYLFGRHQDVALQKARRTVSQRNHLRLWMAPFTLAGQKVWVGQISRDIGVKLTTQSWSLTTHRVSPYVDEDRDYLLQDLVMTGRVDRLGYAKGVGPSTPQQPRTNLTGDPYYTDGLRLVVILGSEPHSPLEVQSIGWERPILAR